MHTEMQGDPDVYIDYSDEFATVLGAAYLLDAAGYRNFALSRTAGHGKYSGVDLEATLSNGSKVFLDFKRALDAAERRDNALREQINVGLRRAMRDNPTVRNAIDGRFVQVTVPRSPTDENEVGAAVAEILGFVMSTHWQAVEKNEFIAFDPHQFPLLDRLGARVYVAQGATYLSVAEGARSFEPSVPYRRVARIVMEESKKHFEVQPVWLAISLADVTASIPSDTLDPQRAVSFDIDATSFEQIIVGSAESASVYRRSRPLESAGDATSVLFQAKDSDISTSEQLRQSLIYQASALEGMIRDFELNKQSGALGHISTLPYATEILRYQDIANQLLKLAPNDSFANSALQHAKTLRYRLNQD